MSLKKPVPQSKPSKAAVDFAQANSGDTMRVNANIRTELHTALKVRAAQEGRSIREILEEWIESWHPAKK